MQGSTRPTALSAPSDPNLLRVLVVGETKVGKTLLIRRLCHQVFALSTTACSSGTRATSRNSGGGCSDAEISEDNFYFASCWGPTIGFEVDCLVRDAYGVATAGGVSVTTALNRDGSDGGGVGNQRYFTPSGRPEEESTPYWPPPSSPVAANPPLFGAIQGGLNGNLRSPGTGQITRRSSTMAVSSVNGSPATGGGGSVSARQYSGLSFRPTVPGATGGTDSGASSPRNPSSSTSRVNRSANFGEDNAFAGPPTSFQAACPSSQQPQRQVGNGGNASSSYHVRASHHSTPQQRPVTQTVELYELGGTRAFSTDCTLPLPLMGIDGIIFVYDRANTSSTTNLAVWYTRMKALFSKDDAQGKRPKVMLLGTQLQKSSLFTLLTNMHGKGDDPNSPSNSTSVGKGGGDGCVDDMADEDYFPPDDALLDPQVRLQAQQRLSKKNSRRTHRGRLGGKVRQWCLSITSIARLSFHPSLVLSEQYQEERSVRSFRLVFHVMEWLARVVVWTERVVLYWMAVVLFGVYQDVVTVQQPSVRAALESIKEDPFFSAQCYVCHLYDRFAFESAVDEIVGFFDTLHRDKLNPTPA